MWQYLVFLGAAVNLIGASFYIRDTLRGQTRPNRVTWFLWSAIPMIAVAAALTKGVGWAVLPVFMSGFTPFLVFLASFVNKKAYWQLEKRDYLYGSFSVLALVLWAITKEPNVAIVLAIVSDSLAFMPTLIKSWKNPESESAITYACGIFSALTSFAAMKMWGLSELAFPLYLIITNLLLVLFIQRRKFFK